MDKKEKIIYESEQAVVTLENIDCYTTDLSVVRVYFEDQVIRLLIDDNDPAVINADMEPVDMG